MKKLTAVISAAAIAVSMAVPITASAATLANGADEQTKLEYNFETGESEKYTGSDWSVSGTTTGSTSKEKLYSGVADGQLILKNGGITAITKGGQNFYGDYTVSYDVTFTKGTSNFNGLDFILTHSTASGDKTTTITIASGGGVLQVDSASLSFDTPTTYAYIKENEKYTFTVKVEKGEVYLTIVGAFTNAGISVNNLKIADLPSDYVKTTGLKFGDKKISNAGTEAIDNIKLVIGKSTFTADNITGSKYVENEDNAINIVTTKLFPEANTNNVVTMTKDGSAFTDYTVTWNSSSIPSGYKVNPTIKFNSAPAAGTYTLSFEIKDVYGYMSKPSWTFEVESKEIAPTAETKLSSITGNIKLGGRDYTITNSTIEYGGRVTKLYETTITAGSKKVNGGTITATVGEQSMTQNFGTTVGAGETGIVYSVLSQAADVIWLEPGWTYSFNEE